MTALRLVQTRHFPLVGAPGRLLGRAQCVMRQARPAAFMETIGDILCFPFWPLFPPAVLAWCPTGEGRNGASSPSPAMPGGASGRAAQRRGQWADELWTCLYPSVCLKTQEGRFGDSIKGGCWEKVLGVFSSVLEARASLQMLGAKAASST